MLKKTYHLGYLGYLFLLILSIIFYKERTIFSDTAFHLFYIIKEGDWFLEGHFRYGAVLTQSYPLLGSKLGLSLNAIAMLYSVSFVINSAICYFLCGTVFKNHQLALALLLFNILFVSDVFFWPLSELQMGTAVMLVLFSYLSTKEYNNQPLLLLLMGVATFVIISFFHPLMIFPYLFTVVFLLLSKQVVIKRSALLILLVFFVISYVIKEQLFVSGHDKEASSGVKKLLDTFPHYFDTYASKEFFKSCLAGYCWITIAFFGIVIAYIKNRSWLKLVFFCAFSVGYILLVNVSYPSADVAKFYIENFYTPLGIFIALPFVFDVLPAIERYKNMASVLLILIIISGAVRIYSVGEKYVTRLNWERNFLVKNGHEKLVVADTFFPRDTIIMPWAMHYEFWLLSTIEQGTTASITVSDNVDNIAWATDRSKSFLTPWGLFHYQDLPPRYFVFKDTTTTYRIMK